MNPEQFEDAIKVAQEVGPLLTAAKGLARFVGKLIGAKKKHREAKRTLTMANKLTYASRVIQSGGSVALEILPDSVLAYALSDKLREILSSKRPTIEKASDGQCETWESIELVITDLQSITNSLKDKAENMSSELRNDPTFALIHEACFKFVENYQNCRCYSTQRNVALMIESCRGMSDGAMRARSLCEKMTERMARALISQCHSFARVR